MHRMIRFAALVYPNVPELRALRLLRLPTLPLRKALRKIEENNVGQLSRPTTPGLMAHRLEQSYQAACEAGPGKHEHTTMNKAYNSVTLICSSLAWAAVDAQTLRDLTKRATSVMRTRPFSLVQSDEAGDTSEEIFSRIGVHISSGDLFPSFERETPVRFI